MVAGGRGIGAGDVLGADSKVQFPLTMVEHLFLLFAWKTGRGWMKLPQNVYDAKNVNYLAYIVLANRESSSIFAP